MQALKFLVIGMGVLIFVLLGVVVFAMVQRMGGAGPGEGDGEAGPGFGEVRVEIPPGCRIAAAEPQGEARIVMRLDGGPSCDQILILDAESGEILGRFVTPFTRPSS